MSNRSRLPGRARGSHQFALTVTSAANTAIAAEIPSCAGRRPYVTVAEAYVIGAAPTPDVIVTLATSDAPGTSKRNLWSGAIGAAAARGSRTGMPLSGDIGLEGDESDGVRLTAIAAGAGAQVVLSIAGYYAPDEQTTGMDR